MKIEYLRNELGHPGIPNNGNFYALKEMDINPNKLALKYPHLENGILKYEELSFQEFKDSALKISTGLLKQNFRSGDRVIILFPVSVDLYLTIFACFYCGIVPVFLDISMGQKQLIKSIRNSKAKGIISVDKLLKFKLLVPALWWKKCFSIDRKRFLVKDFKDIKANKVLSKKEIHLCPKESALITFTSGSTGIPKGANRTIEILLNQKIVSEYLWPHSNQEVDMPAFPMIVLQNLGCGVSSILPLVDFQNYLNMDASLIVKQMMEEKVTRFSAQPYFIEKISDYLLDQKIELKSVKSLVVGGAVVSRILCEKIVMAFPNADCNIVYGSTEAEPIAYAEMRGFINSRGRGLLLGKIIEVLDAKIITLCEKPSVENEVVSGGIGEIILSGAHVIKEYIDNHPANEILKIKSKDGNIWHRTGDLGYLDEDKNLWLVGRISDQIESLEGLIPCYDLEEDLLRLLGLRSAFIDSNKCLFIEGKFDIETEKKTKHFLDEHKLSHFNIKFIPKLPVDQRHFSRVDRACLRLNV
jgi:acyl-CoA synthetase (AMP-forming)/AMP-acid ligase II